MLLSRYRYVCKSLGVLDILHSDQGRKNFESTLFHQVFGIHKARTTAYHPQGDGMVEHFNRSLLQLLRCYVDTEKHYLPLVLYAYPTTQYFSPFQGGHLNHHLSVNPLILTHIITQINYQLSLEVLSILTFQLVLNNRINIPTKVVHVNRLRHLKQPRHNSALVTNMHPLNNWLPPQVDQLLLV